MTLRIQLSFLFLLLWAGWCSAQKQYIGIDGEYNFSFRRHSAEIHSHFLLIPQDLRGARSYGSGPGTTVFYGYYLRKGISASLGYNFAATGNVLGDSVATMYGLSQKAILAFRFEKSPGNRVSFFHQSGFIWSFYNRIVHNGDSWYYDYQGSHHWVYKETLHGGFGYGYSGSFGVQISVRPGLKLTTAIRLQLLRWAPKYSTLNSCTYNGTDVMPGMTTAEKETVFEKHPYNMSFSPYLSSYVNSYPYEQAKFYAPFYAWGMNIGLIYSWEKVKKEKTKQP